jgi:YesN/AraC family two-component response regulator
MVSQRCIVSVKDTLEKLGLQYEYVTLGEASLNAASEHEIELLKKNLKMSGFEILENKKNILCEKIKRVILQMVRDENGLPDTNISYYIAAKLDYDYTYLSNIFSEINGTTIERFIIMHKIERVKELLQDDELNITDVSYKLHYSSVAHLSAQFKKITGVTPSVYKKQKHKLRSKLEDL